MVAVTGDHHLKEGKLVYGCLWTGRQVILAKHYISKLRNLDDNEILRRVRIVGGSLRDILLFEEDDFERKVGEALNLDANTDQELAEGRYQFSFKPEPPSSLLIGICPRGLNGRTITSCQQIPQNGLVRCSRRRKFR
jgi:hypothetical protein